MTRQDEPGAGTPSWEECVEVLDRLPKLAVEERPAAILRLLRNPSPGIRQRAIHMGVALLPEEQVVRFLREEADDVLRNAGLEILKRKGKSAFSTACALLEDPDGDVVLQAVLVLDHLKDPRALDPLRPLLRHEDPNVVQATVTAIGHLGDARAVPDLLPFLHGDPWLQMAAVQALGDLRCKTAARPLAGLLGDLMVGPIAAEALARVGGASAFRALASHWVSFQAELEPETMLGLLAHVARGLPAAPKAPPGLRESIVPVLNHPSETARTAAAEALLSLGPGSGDGEALAVLAQGAVRSSELPSCLERRGDLVPSLLAWEGIPRLWGLRLAAGDPASAGSEDLERALATAEAREAPEVVAELLAGREDGAGVRALLDYYLTLPTADRPLMVGALRARGGEIRALLDSRSDLDATTSAVLDILLAGGGGSGAEGLEGLPAGERPCAIGQLMDFRDFLERLPWERWISEDPDIYLQVACEAAAQAGVRSVLTPLRALLSGLPSPDVVRALGEAGDSASAPILVGLLDGAAPLLRALVLESLGHIGGPEARGALRGAVGESRSGEVRTVYRALSHAAVEEDVPLFRAATTHSDWGVRLAAAEVLGRFPTAENLPYLAMLSADPVAVVAQRAKTLVEG